MTAEDIKTILASEPFLTANGIEIYRKMTDARAEKFRDNRERLEHAIDECTRAEQWLSYIEPTAKIGRCNSYHLKHLAEKATGAYICNGALIVAALHRGFRYVQADVGSLNATFNMSRRSINAAAEMRLFTTRPVEAASR